MAIAVLKIDLIKTLDKVPLEVAKYPVGLDSVKNLLIHKLNLNFVDEMLKVGIRGIGACKGHPLSLEVIGCFLYDKQDEACWTEALRNITLIPDIQKRVFSTLKISYDALSYEEREIFLDIACLFIGEDKTLPIVFWNSLYKIAETVVSNLSMKLLIKIDDRVVFDMHDHLRDLGQIIAEKDIEGTRLWKHEHLSTLSNNMNVSHLRLNGGNPKRLEMLYRPGLRYLHLQNVHIEGMTKDTVGMLPPTLIWLRFQDCTFSIGKNRTINKILTATRKMYIALRKKEQMQHLDLRECESLNKFPDTIGNLSQLQHLDLGWCKKLNKLPHTIANLSQLQHLGLSKCKMLNKLPDTIGNLSQLQHLDLSKCKMLNKLPDTIGNLSKLQHLKLGECKSLNKLPDTIGNLSQLQHLDLRGCLSLNKLPGLYWQHVTAAALGLGMVQKLKQTP
ncbi:hypothetical protein SUGI_0915980 [Cryptomeria japonica]|nr:hypothetical protein SUGI_0915980 [Cryptomeria japonica]